ncbi:hypothetical protein E2C01_031286 [Portunus trituberculatus]|uniref:Uncharacterized protein n=1 Tax=Portunus trituberculatus TaxID=210409 RepID=A0A5B7EWG3_PORTR|nr:hypothetical protein [Portunus trituberculatus]
MPQHLFLKRSQVKGRWKCRSRKAVPEFTSESIMKAQYDFPHFLGPYYKRGKMALHVACLCLASRDPSTCMGADAPITFLHVEAQ